MSTVFFSIGMTLDGFIAGPNRGPENPLGDGGVEINKWMFQQQAFLDNLQLDGNGETGEDHDLLADIFNRTGASIMGKRMFEEGEHNWPENAPFHCLVFVLTQETREPWPRKGETTFYFVNDGIASALKQAREAAGDKDIRISGGANTLQQFLNAGLVDEGIIHLSPMLLGKGVRLFENLDPETISIEVIKARNSSQVTHLHCKFN